MVISVPADVADIVDRELSIFGAPDANAAYLLVDRHDPHAIAFTQVDVEDSVLRPVDVTYGELADKSRRLATALAARGVGEGDRVGVLMGKRVELAVSFLALMRLGAVYIPLFTAFAEPAIEMRLTSAAARLVLTESSQAAKVAGIEGIEVIVVENEFDALISDNDPTDREVAVGGDGMIILIFTSGTTGPPKGVPVPLRAVASIVCYLDFGLDVQAGDVFWNAADPGWAYGLYYGIVGVLARGYRNILLHSGFNAEVTARLLADLAVTNFAAAPTVYRSLKSDSAFGGYQLRRASSAGEPLTPDVIEWAPPALGSQVRDHYGQTEQGMFVNNHWRDGLRQEILPGSMGIAMPGFTTAIIDDQIAVDTTASPLMWFLGYLDAADKTASRYTADGRWYLTGDTARVDDEGHYFFTARDDDIILMAGYRIGPFDVESVLITHPSVVDVAVVGRRDELRGEVVEAFVVLDDATDPSDALEAELQDLVKTGFAAHAYPRRVHFVDALPKTPSGKIQRFLLRRG
ncbi:AMP-binding protein [Gordonia sp. TBRC 11910]|uniref:AMP-binding protein n=1 Tax=Gordonia asplenii TaxID=2725283 RepID=A0A848L763_9ACTN|nr:AMP-binding protein [Gordonia asplenii]NMO04351.1 AMP-binding protein [Gordonia asplenii]